VFRELGLPLISDEEVEAATYAHGSKDMPARNVVEDLAAVEEMMKRNITGLDIVGALSCSGFEDIASNILNMLRQRVTGDYLQTSAILDRQFDVVSAVNDINDYQDLAPLSHQCRTLGEIKNIAGVVQPGSIE
jgi:glycerol dehydratase large subunit